MNFVRKTLFEANKLVTPLLIVIARKTNQGRQLSSLKRILPLKADNLLTDTTNFGLFPRHSSTFRQCPLIIGNSQILLPKSPSLISAFPQNDTINQQVRTYKVKLHPKRRCKGCYFVRKNGRLFVECTLKPRHKQMELQSKDQLWKEDYSKGHVKPAAFWKWSKECWYRRGNNQWARFDWLQGKYDS